MNDQKLADNGDTACVPDWNGNSVKKQHDLSETAEEDSSRWWNLPNGKYITYPSGMTADLVDTRALRFNDCLRFRRRSSAGQHGRCSQALSFAPSGYVASFRDENGYRVLGDPRGKWGDETRPRTGDGDSSVG